uniref:C2H2-type domain-containing protein n=1 Tax=Aplanochytrium stocchinoi TaxID=215587 RepID=A0A7S3PK91_9STRA|mmetsp:Transcript_30492/g.37743  ORF Transcript_30492/g.37743 Transcript_30492/m.37743 type:complete len:480 (+) Transcript_30492:92-1531(+)
MDSVPAINNLVQLAQINQMLHQQLLQKAQNSNMQTVQSLGNSATTFGGVDVNMNMSLNLNNFSQFCNPKLGSLQSLPLNPLPPFATPNRTWQLPSQQQQQFSTVLKNKLNDNITVMNANTNKSNEQPVNLKRARTHPPQDENLNLMNLENSMNYFNKKSSDLFARTRALEIEALGLTKPTSVLNGNVIKPEPLMPQNNNNSQTFSFGVSKGLANPYEKNNIKIEKRGYKVGKRVKLTLEESNKCLEFLDKKRSEKKMKNFVCKYPGCKKRFSWKWSMETHSRTHQGDSARTYKCKHCDKGFFTVGCLKSHTKIHTRKPGGFICEAEGCGKTYSTSEGLRLHTRNHHQVDKKWRCMVPGCTRAFVRQADLRLHVIRIHSLERPFPCPVRDCTKGFACYSELKRHMAVHQKKEEMKSLHRKLSEAKSSNTNNSSNNESTNQVQEKSASQVQEHKQEKKKDTQVIPETKQEYLAAQVLADIV